MSTDSDSESPAAVPVPINFVEGLNDQGRQSNWVLKLKLFGLYFMDLKTPTDFKGPEH